MLGYAAPAGQTVCGRDGAVHSQTYGTVSQGMPHPRFYGTFPRIIAHWLADVLGRIADHKITRIDELLPWRYAAAAA